MSKIAGRSVNAPTGAVVIWKCGNNPPVGYADSPLSALWVLHKGALGAEQSWKPAHPKAFPPGGKVAKIFDF